MASRASAKKATKNPATKAAKKAAKPAQKPTRHAAKSAPWEQLLQKLEALTTDVKTAQQAAERAEKAALAAAASVSAGGRRPPTPDSVEGGVTALTALTPTASVNFAELGESAEIEFKLVDGTKLSLKVRDFFRNASKFMLQIEKSSGTRLSDSEFTAIESFLTTFRVTANKAVVAATPDHNSSQHDQ